MNYKNPVILCDYSDPDVIRVGNTFYMTASSFNFLPGLPILTSCDLVNWKLVNYACKKLPKIYDEVQNACGIWAPSIRFHDGKFYIFFGMPDEGLFFVCAENPLAQWSDPVCVWAGRGFEDPCPLWDSDGRVWLVHAYVKSRIGFNSKLGILELDPKTLCAISEDRVIFDGTKTQPTIEGPKIYKRGGFYYIFAPAGGVSVGWQTVLRSKNLFGDWEEKIVLAQGKSAVNGPHQGAWVESSAQNDEKISDWFLHFQHREPFGRIVHLQPLKWTADGWCKIGSAIFDKDEVGEPLMQFDFPFDEFNLNSEEKFLPNKKCGFGGDFAEFQFSANPRLEWAEFGEKSVRLSAQNENRTIWTSGNVLTKKIDSESFEFSCEVDCSKIENESFAGIVALGDEYCALGVKKTGESFFATEIKSVGGNTDAERTEKTRVICEIAGEKFIFALKFCANNQNENCLLSILQADGKIAASVPFNLRGAHWVGGRFGFFVKGRAGSAVFSSIHIKSNPI